MRRPGAGFAMQRLTWGMLASGSQCFGSLRWGVKIVGCSDNIWQPPLTCLSLQCDVVRTDLIKSGGAIQWACFHFSRAHQSSTEPLDYFTVQLQIQYIRVHGACQLQLSQPNLMIALANATEPAKFQRSTVPCNPCKTDYILRCWNSWHVWNYTCFFMRWRDLLKSEYAH